MDERLGDLSPAEFCQLELGLFYLEQRLAGQSVGALWTALNHYTDLGPRGREVVRRVRLRMGDAARGGQWRERLNEYRKVPVELRMFTTAGPPGHRVLNGTLFERYPSPHLPQREVVYRAALADAVPYDIEPARAPVPPGAECFFKRRDGAVESLRIPSWIQAAPPASRLAARASRVREPFDVTRDDLAQAFKEMDRCLESYPQISDRNFEQRFQKMRFSRVDPAAGQLVDGLGVFTVDGVAHTVGLMNAGKSTLLDGLAFIGVQRGLRVGYVMPSISAALAKVRFLRALGIRAVPLIGRTTRERHVESYWRDELYDVEAGNALPGRELDPAAEFTTSMCLLEPLRTGAGRGDGPLREEDFPCRGRLKLPTKRELHDCPLTHVCPQQAATRAVPDAQVWVMTSSGLVSSRMEGSSYRARQIEAIQHELGLLLVDEADKVMGDFDQRFMLQEPLTFPGGWSARTAIACHDSLDATWHEPLTHPDVRSYQRHMQRHHQALAGLYPLLVTTPTRKKPDKRSKGQGKGARGRKGQGDEDLLSEIVSEGPFSGFSLLNRLARSLHGITTLQERPDQAEKEEAADRFFEEFLGPVARNPFKTPPGHLDHLLTAMTAGYDTDWSAQVAAERWLLEHAPKDKEGNVSDWVEQTLPQLVRLLMAGIWATRITTSFFGANSLLPAVQKQMPLDAADSFFRHQPPPDLQMFVPEQAMGNMLALQWKANRDDTSGSLEVLWLRGVGRWLLYHLHDLLACEGIEGPNVVLTSATSWMPGSARYHVDITPQLILREPEPCAEALRQSRMLFRPQYRSGDHKGIYVSGAGGRQRREDALREVLDAICNPAPGASRSLVDQVRERLDADRQRLAFVTLSGKDAAACALHMNLKTRLSARHVTSDSHAPGRYGLAYRRIGRFASTDADVMLAPEGSLQRGHNVLNERGVAAFGALFYLARLHPPADDLSFPLAVLNQYAMQRLLHPVDGTAPGVDLSDQARRLRADARGLWLTLMGQPLFFSRLIRMDLRRAFVSDLMVQLYQTLGRTIRGNVPTRIYLIDAAFAPRAANRRETAGDTDRTSVLVAGRQLISHLLAPPELGAPSGQRLEHEIAKATWGLLDNLFETMDWGQ
ncbi:hypothetical protein ACH4GK_09510 [Streptomyces rimosus]|uniref:pPIWI_RE_Z domain-containing protein n=1 Tax=Streptomyces rimosus TaxID=1927 RepID=UPI00131A8413|nr:hypothetical protein [Streptomyces rimosus]